MKTFIFPTSFLVILCMLLELATCEKTYTWNVSLQNWSPDGVESPVIAINGQFPGPTIRGGVGEKIFVHVTNSLLEEGISIHWHGLRQRGTSWSDGTSGISQCPTLPGHNFTYEFTLDKAGTHFYHGHHKMERVQGLYGMLIVEEADNRTVGDFKYDDEFEILLSDWWHKSSTQQEDGLTSKPMVWVGEPQSLLINGKGQYNCSMSPGLPSSSSAATSPCVFTGSEQYAPTILRVSQQKSYRIRLVSATSLASLNFAIQNHTLHVVEVDGNLVEPFEADNIYIFPGQSFSVVIKTDQSAEPRRFWVSASVVARKPNTTQGLTVLSYDTDDAVILPTATPQIAPLWNDTVSMKKFSGRILAREGSPAPPPTSGKRIYLLNTQNFVDEFTKWAINNVSLKLPETPYLAAYRYNLTNAFDSNSPPTNYNSDYDLTKPAANKNATVGDMVYKFDLNTTVDVILQNANAIAESTSETHPWHLHGHDFWVMAQGDGKFKDEYEANFNVKNAPLKSTEVVYPFGWTALRFVADNPGVWAFHCHIEPHVAMGMGVVFAEGTDELTGVPTAGLQCGLVTGRKN